MNGFAATYQPQLLQLGDGAGILGCLGLGHHPGLPFTGLGEPLGLLPPEDHNIGLMVFEDHEGETGGFGDVLCSADGGVEVLVLLLGGQVWAGEELEVDIGDGVCYLHFRYVGSTIDAFWSLSRGFGGAWLLRDDLLRVFQSAGGLWG